MGLYLSIKDVQRTPFTVLIFWILPVTYIGVVSIILKFVLDMTKNFTSFLGSGSIFSTIFQVSLDTRHNVRISILDIIFYPLYVGTPLR